MGVKKDDKKMFECALKAAEMGDDVAQYNVGLCYHFGRGVEKDDAKAAGGTGRHPIKVTKMQLIC